MKIKTLIMVALMPFTLLATDNYNKVTKTDMNINKKVHNNKEYFENHDFDVWKININLNAGLLKAYSNDTLYGSETEAKSLGIGTGARFYSNSGFTYGLDYNYFTTEESLFKSVNHAIDLKLGVHPLKMNKLNKVSFYFIGGYSVQEIENIDGMFKGFSYGAGVEYRMEPFVLALDVKKQDLELNNIQYNYIDPRFSIKISF